MRIITVIIAVVLLTREAVFWMVKGTAEQFYHDQIEQNQRDNVAVMQRLLDEGILISDVKGMEHD